MSSDCEWTNERDISALQIPPEREWYVELLARAGEWPPLPGGASEEAYVLPATLSLSAQDAVAVLSTDWKPKGYKGWLNALNDIGVSLFASGEDPGIRFSIVALLTPHSELCAWLNALEQDQSAIEIAVRLGAAEEGAAHGDPSVQAAFSLEATAYWHPLPAALFPVPALVSESVPKTFPPSSVAVAVVDSGIGFANERFRTRNGQTRFHATWAMDLPPPDDGTASVPLGRVLYRDEIDQALVDAGGDDETVYRNLGLLDPRTSLGRPLAYSRTHGTHVMDLAAGYATVGVEADVADTRPLIGVQLPREVTEDTSGAFLEPWLRRALCWIEEQTAVLTFASGAHAGHPLPVVLNLSYGATTGPDDGEHSVEELIEAFLNPGNGAERRVVMSAGNSYLARLHAPREIAVGEAKELEWRIQPDDRTPSVLQIWLRPVKSNQCQAISVVLEPPCNPPTAQSSSAGTSLDLVCEDNAIARMYHQWVERTIDGVTCYREVVTLVVAPTAFEDPAMPRARSGVWRVRMENLDASRAIHPVCRIARDDSLPFFRLRGRQSYFEDPTYERFKPGSGRWKEVDGDSIVRRRGTLNTYGVQQDVRFSLVGGYRWCDGIPARYTSSGPQGFPPDPRLGPDLSAVSDDSGVHTGVIAAGTLSGTVHIQNGTSVAAPQVTRAVADLLAQDPTALGNAVPAGASGGPHAVYAAADSGRLGAGRLERPELPAHRKRLDR